MTWKKCEDLSRECELVFHEPSKCILECYVMRRRTNSNLILSILWTVIFLALPIFCLDSITESTGYLFVVCWLLSLWLYYRVILWRGVKWQSLEKWTVIRDVGFQMTRYQEISIIAFYLKIWNIFLPAGHFLWEETPWMQYWTIESEKFLPLFDTSLPVLSEVFYCFQVKYYLHVSLKTSGKLHPLFLV